MAVVEFVVEGEELLLGLGVKGMVFCEEVGVFFGGMEEGGFGDYGGALGDVAGCEDALAFEGTGSDFVEHSGGVVLGGFGFRYRVV